MKKGTALFMAFTMIVGIVGGGVVLFSVPVRAVEYPSNLVRSDLPVVSAADVSTNGIVLCTDGNTIVRAGSNENGLYPFVTDSGQLRVASKNPGKLFIYDNGSVSTVNADTKTFQYGYDSSTLIYQNNIAFTGYTFSFASSGSGAFNCMYDAAVVLFFENSYKNASKLYHSPSIGNALIHLNGDDSLDITDAVGSNTTYGYVVRVGSRIYVITPNDSYRATRFKLNISNYINIDQEYIVNNNSYLYGYYDYNSSNIAVLGFNNLTDAMEQVYFWETGNIPDPEPDPDPDPDPIPPITNNGYSFVLPYGYAAKIFSEQGVSISLYKHMKQNSNIIASINPSIDELYWPNDSSTFWIESSNSIDSYSIGTILPPENGSSRIPWRRGDVRNRLGQTKDAYFSTSHLSPGSIVICNPDANVVLNNDFTLIDVSSYILVTINDIQSDVQIDVYKLYTKANNDSVQSDSRHLLSTVTEKYTVDSLGLIRDSYGQVVNLIPGGSNETDPEESALDKIASDIDQFFAGTWRHIQQMVTSAGKLPSTIIEMYSWLPEEYKAVLFSAFGITVVVAILKVML